MDLKVAAHAGSEALFGPDVPAERFDEWAELTTRRRLEPGMFVAAVDGDSMDEMKENFTAYRRSVQEY